MNPFRGALVALLIAIFLPGCVTAPAYPPAPSRAPVPAPVRVRPPAGPPQPSEPGPGSEPQGPPPPPEVVVPPPAPPRSSGATASLLEQGRQQRAAGDLAMATSTLERAIRINPRDPTLWLELGRVKLQQGDYAQAENMGRRAAAAAGSDARLRPQIDELITAARRAEGKGG